MTDTSNLPPPSGAYASEAEDRVLPIAVHALYLLAFATGGLSAIVGLIAAYVGRRDGDFTWRASHYEFAIWTFWLTLAGSAIAWLLIGVGIPLLLVLVGIVPILVGGLALALICIWFAVRSVLGLVYAIRGEAYPRPRNLIV